MIESDQYFPYYDASSLVMGKSGYTMRLRALSDRVASGIVCLFTLVVLACLRLVKCVRILCERERLVLSFHSFI